ncbi:hypothetical protein D3C72_2040700 [compost metagenome]
MLSAVALDPAEVCEVICWIIAMVCEICPADEVWSWAASEMLWMSSARVCDTPSISSRATPASWARRAPRTTSAVVCSMEITASLVSV